MFLKRLLFLKRKNVIKVGLKCYLNFTTLQCYHISPTVLTDPHTLSYMYHYLMLLEQREFFCVCVCLALPFVLQKVTVAEVWLLIRNGTKSDGLCSVFGG